MEFRFTPPEASPIDKPETGPIEPLSPDAIAAITGSADMETEDIEGLDAEHEDKQGQKPSSPTPPTSKLLGPDGVKAMRGPED